MARREDAGPMGRMVRFSFGPLTEDPFEGDIEILRQCLSSAPQAEWQALDGARCIPHGLGCPTRLLGGARSSLPG